MVGKRWLILLLLKWCVIMAWSSCSEHIMCGDCVRDPMQCQWCSKDIYNTTRCIEDNQTFVDCDEIYIENPRSEVTVAVNRSYSSGNNVTEKNYTITQIRPQRYSIKLRPGRSVNFKINFKPASDYPAELYFLLDTAKSMIPIRKAINDNSKQIYEKMLDNTKNVRIGLGSFMDKNTLPFITKVNKSNPISSYRHLCSLSSNYTEFQSAVTAMNISDAFHLKQFASGFDALAQAITCTSEVGWSQFSRKIIIYISDVLYHVAGDGKVAGITQPYDGKCYTKDGIYTKELEMDYPSIGMIRKLAADNDVIIIFTVLNEEKIRENYEKLKESIRGSECTHFTIVPLSGGGPGIADFDNGIENTMSLIYQQITHTIKLKEHMLPADRKFIDVKYDPDCTSKQTMEYLNKYCTVSIGKEISLTGTIALSKAYKKKDRMSVDIAIESIKERLTLDVEVIDCKCAETPEADSDYCHGVGTKTCGICNCDLNRYGSKCECTYSNGTLDKNAGCKAPGSDLPCSGRGDCICGICQQCSRGFSGKFCHCNEFSCTTMCHGRGDCDCGKCKNCTGSWTGDDCNCSTLPCQKINEKVCNGRGKCKCAKCECDQIDRSWDARRSQNKDTCEIDKCTDCHSKQCQLLTPCAVCEYDNAKYERNENCPSCHASVTVIKNQQANDTMICRDVVLQNDLGCYITFTYRYNKDTYGINLFVTSERNCIQSYYMYGGILLATILVVGIATIVAWKLITDARDRREYERFLEEHKGDTSGPCDNPIYEPATTTFRNPAFRKKSVDFN